MRGIEIVQVPVVHTLNEDSEFVCTHASYTIEPPCCKYPYENGNLTCACGGEYSVTCDNTECDGMTYEQELSILISEGII